MSEQDRNLAQMDESDTQRHRVAQSLIQEAIDDVGRNAQGRDPGDVQTELVEALAIRGIGEQPPRWLDTVASRLTEGHRYIEDARDA